MILRMMWVADGAQPLRLVRSPRNFLL